MSRSYTPLPASVSMACRGTALLFTLVEVSVPFVGFCVAGMAGTKTVVGERMQIFPHTHRLILLCGAAVVLCKLND
jgi:hypothetical protein